MDADYDPDDRRCGDDDPRDADDRMHGVVPHLAEVDAILMQPA